MVMSRRAETVSRDQIHGWVAPGFEPVRQAFADNFAQRGDLGAACAVYWHGEPVVDLWGGLRDRGLPWRQDTLVLVFSVTKGMTAAALAVAHARGLLDYDTPVAAYWPEFTAALISSHACPAATADRPTAAPIDAYQEAHRVDPLARAVLAAAGRQRTAGRRTPPGPHR
jgi:CubicO group peptidase (beta-lactamase class C family)